jgi:hypothetical protein
MKLKKGWTHYLHYEKNKSQSLQRLRDQVNDSFEDLTLLADKIPSNEQSMLFTPQNIEKFLHSLLQLNDLKNIDARKARLAATCAKVGLEYCKLHGSISSKNSVLNELLENELTKCQIFCASIASDLELQEKESTSK